MVVPSFSDFTGKQGRKYAKSAFLWFFSCGASRKRGWRPRTSSTEASFLLFWRAEVTRSKEPSRNGSILLYITSHKKSREIQREKIFFFLHYNREMKVVNRQTQCRTVAFSRNFVTKKLGNFSREMKVINMQTAQNSCVFTIFFDLFWVDAQSQIWILISIWWNIYAFVAKDKYQLSELENKLESTPPHQIYCKNTEHDGEKEKLITQQKANLGDCCNIRSSQN